jgi:hypothetical protein
MKTLGSLIFSGETSGYFSPQIRKGTIAQKIWEFPGIGSINVAVNPIFWTVD